MSFLFDHMFSLKHAEPIGDWVGLRPGRTEMRVEKEDLEISNEHGLTTRIRVTSYLLSNY